MADRFYRDIELPDFASPKTVANPDAGFIQLYGKDGKLVAHNSSGETVELKAVATDQIVIVDSIASSFNGVATQFTLKTSNVNFINTELDTEARLIISVGGTIQSPDPTQGGGFYLSGGTDRTTDPVKINFVEAPRAGQTFFGTAVKSTVSAVVPYVSPALSIAYAIALG